MDYTIQKAAFMKKLPIICDSVHSQGCEHVDSLAFAYTIGENLKKHITIFNDCKWYINITCIFYFFQTKWC